jgi:hypothetical protein
VELRKRKRRAHSWSQLKEEKGCSFREEDQDRECFLRRQLAEGGALALVCREGGERGG